MIIESKGSLHVEGRDVDKVRHCVMSCTNFGLYVSIFHSADKVDLGIHKVVLWLTCNDDIFLRHRSKNSDASFTTGL